MIIKKVITKYGQTFEQYELDLEEPGPEQLSLFLEASGSGADDSKLETITVNTKGDK